MAEIRKDPIVDRWVIISAEREARPYDFSNSDRPRQKGFCPFCHGSEEKTPHELLAHRRDGSSPNTPGWTLRVVPNKFPALTIEGNINPVEQGIYRSMNGVGAHEVIIDSPDHDLALEQLPQKHIENCFRAFKERILDLKQDSRFQYTLIFKNHGKAAGATLEHSHTQLIALPIIPELAREELDGCRRHYELRRSCVYCDIIAQDRADGRRIVFENDLFTALCPFAPRFPFETWIIPRDHAPIFENHGDQDFAPLAEVVQKILLKLRNSL
ncbi:MAG: DUF4931 domain-containing protein, partial [Nitrospinales bacterium]